VVQIKKDVTYAVNDVHAANEAITHSYWSGSFCELGQYSTVRNAKAK